MTSNPPPPPPPPAPEPERIEDARQVDLVEWLMEESEK